MYIHLHTCILFSYNGHTCLCLLLGIPFGTVNLRHGVPPKETEIASTAGAGSLLVEFEVGAHTCRCLYLHTYKYINVHIYTQLSTSIYLIIHTHMQGVIYHHW